MLKYWIEDKARTPIFAAFAEMQYWAFSRVPQPAEENNGPQTGCEETKLPLSAGDTTVDAENTNISSISADYPWARGHWN